jgi:hypothetical protein
MTQVKWLSRIDAVSAVFDGYQQRVAYFYKRDANDPGQPVTRMRPRALLVPPGFPDYLTRRRILDRGRIAVHGRAWSGQGSISRVEFCVDDHWIDAALGRASGKFSCALGVSSGTPRPASTYFLVAPPTPLGTFSPPIRPGTFKAWATTWPRKSASPCVNQVGNDDCPLVCV